MINFLKSMFLRSGSWKRTCCSSGKALLEEEKGLGWVYEERDGEDKKYNLHLPVDGIRIQLHTDT